MSAIHDLGTMELAGIGMIQFTLGLMLVYAVYWARERSLSSSFVAGIGLAVTTVIVQYYVGTQYFMITHDQTVQAVVVSALAGISGLAISAIAFEPEQNRRTRWSRSPGSHRSDRSSRSDRDIGDYLGSDTADRVAQVTEGGDSNGQN